VCADDVNLLGPNINTTKNAETQLHVRKKFGLEVNSDVTRCMFMSCHQTSGQHCCMKLTNKSFENAAEFKYVGTAITS
jgi:hypothetical protein